MTTSLAALHQRQAYAQRIGPTVRLTVDGAVHATDGAGGNPSPLTIGGRYALICMEGGVYIRQGGPGVTAGATDRFLEAGRFLIVTCDDVIDNRIAVTAAQGLGGYLHITRVDSLDGVARGSAQTQLAQFFSEKSGSTLQVLADAASTSTGAGQLVHGARYLVVCPQLDPLGLSGQLGDDVWIRQGPAGLTVSASPGPNLGMPLPRGTAWTFNVDDATNDRLAVLSATGGNGSSVWITRIDSVA